MFLFIQSCAISMYIVANSINVYKVVSDALFLSRKTMSVFQASLFDLECTVAVKNSLSKREKGEGVIPPAAIKPYLHQRSVLPLQNYTACHTCARKHECRLYP